MKMNKVFRGLVGKGRWFCSSLEWAGVPKERVDAVVIGAGVVGIAVARELAVKLGREVLVVESAPTFGTGSSCRNSEVIHAGIYYPSHSLKVIPFLLFFLFDRIFVNYLCCSAGAAVRERKAFGVPVL